MKQKHFILALVAMLWSFSLSADDVIVVNSWAELKAAIEAANTNSEVQRSAARQRSNALRTTATSSDGKTFIVKDENGVSHYEEDFQTASPIKLGADVVWDEPLYIADGAGVTINLNGKSMVADKEHAHGYPIRNYGKVLIMDSSDEGAGVIECGILNGIKSNGLTSTEAVLVMTGGNIICNHVENEAAIINYGSAIIIGGSIEGNPYAVWNKAEAPLLDIRVPALVSGDIKNESNGNVPDDLTGVLTVAQIGTVKYTSLNAAFAAAEEGETIKMLADATPTLKSQSAITKAAVIDLNGKTLTLDKGDLYFGTTKFQNGNVVVKPGVNASTAVFWMFETQTLTFDNVDIVATGVTGTYLIGINGGTGTAINILNGSSITIDNATTAALTAVICDNGTGNSVTIENSKIDVKNIEGRFYLGGKNGSVTVENSDVDLAGVKEGFYLRADQSLDITDNSTVDITLNSNEGRYGINCTEFTSIYNKDASATVNATVYAPKAAAMIGTTKYETLQGAINAAKAGETVTLVDDVVYNNYVYASGKTTAVNIAKGKDFTLDLAGYSIIGTNDTENNYELITIENGAKLTLVDSKSDGKISYTGTRTTADGWRKRCHTIFNKGTLVVNGGTVENATPATAEAVASAIDNNASWGNLGSLYVNGGTVISTSYYAVRTDVNTHNTTAASKNKSVTQFNGGTVYGFYLMDRGSDLTNMPVNNIDFVLGDEATVDACAYNGQALRFRLNAKSAYDLTAYNNATINGTVTGAVAKIGMENYVKYYAKLQDAVNACVVGDNEVEILADVTEDVVITQLEGVNVVIDGDNKTFTGLMTVFGNGRQSGAETLAIKNINFVAKESADACIVSPDRAVNNKYSYAHNVTVENCTFKDPDGVVNCAAIRHNDGGDKNWTVKSCTVDATMHSLLQVNNVEGKLIVDNCTVNSKNGLNLNSCTNVELTNNTIEVKGYAVRTGVNSGGNLGEAKTYVFNNNTLKTDNSEGDAVIVFRASTVDANLSMTENVVSGTTHISGNTAATKLAIDANYWDGANQPKVAGAEVKVNWYYLNYVDGELRDLTRNYLSGSIIGYTGTDRIWGQVWGNAFESLVIEILDANDQPMGTAKLKDESLLDGDVEVSWYIRLNGVSSNSWEVNWATAPTVNNLPAKVKLFVDGEEVSEGNVVLNGSDNLNKINVAITDASGKILSYQQTVKAALAAVKEGEIITLLHDYKEDVVVAQAPDVKITIDGNNNEFAGTITVDGKSAAYETAGLTIKNVKFLADGISKDASINLGGNNAIRYTSNVTVDNCTFTGTNKDKVGVKNYTGGCKNVTITNSTATGMHSLAQLKTSAGITLANNTVTDSKNGISLGSSTGVVVENCTVKVEGYGVRTDGNTNSDVTVKGSTIEAFIPVVVRNADGEANVTFADGNKFTASNTDDLWCAIGTTEYEENGKVPAASTGIVSVTMKATDLNVEGINDIKAAIGNVYYQSFADAYADAQAGDAITLLADVVVDNSETFWISKSITINGGNHKVISNANRIFRVNASEIEVTLNNVNMVNTAERVGTNDVRGISIDSDLKDVKLTLNNCSVDFTHSSANDWTYAVNISGNGTGHQLTVNGGTYEGANVINVHGANNTVTVENATLTSLYPAHDVYYGAAIWVLQEQNSSVEATGNTFEGNHAIAFNLGTGTALDESNNTDNTKLYVAKADADKYYYTFAEAVAAAENTVKLLFDQTGAGVVIDKDLTIDFNGKTYTVNKTVGSAGTTTLGFQILKDNNVTLKNGTLTSTAVTEGKEVKMLVQNYANLTVDNMKLVDATDHILYVLSNNSGTVNVVNGSEITTDAIALDACKYASYEAPTVTVAEGVKVTGDVEASATLNFAGTLNGNIVINGVDGKVTTAEGKNVTTTVEHYNVIYADGAYALVHKIYVAKIGEKQYEKFAEALDAVQNGETIELTGAEGSEVATEINFDKAITFTITGNAPNYELPVVTFQNATVNIQDATISIPELDARQNATINVVNSTVYDAGGNSIVKSYYNGAINIDAKSTVYTMQLTTMGYVNIAGTVNATWQTNVLGNGMITLASGATFNTAALQLTGEDYSGRDNTDATRVGKPATVIVDGANFTVGRVLSSAGADYSYHSSYGINVGTVDGKSAILDIKNGANVNFFMADGETVNIGAGATVNVNASTWKTACRADEGTVAFANNGAINVTGASQLDIKNITGKAVVIEDARLTDSYVGGRVDAFGTNNISGTSVIGGILSLGYGTNPTEQVVVNITGNFNGTNVLVSTNNSVDNILNVGNAGGDRTTAHFGQLGAFADVNVVNADVTYGYAFIRNDFKALNSTFEIKGGTNTYFSGNAKVVLDNTTWALPGNANIGSYGGGYYGNADVTLKNGSSMTATNLGVEVSGDKVVKITLEDTSNLTATKLTNQGSIVLASIGASVTSNTCDNITTNVADYKVAYVNGVYKVVPKDYVAKVGDARFESLAEALTFATDGATVELLWSEGAAPISMAGTVCGDKTVTITGTANVDWSKGWLYIGRNGEGNGKVIFENANLTSVSNSTAHGINVSGHKKGSTDTNNGTVEFKNSTVVLDYLIQKNVMTLDNSTLTVKNGCSLTGRLANETENGKLATSTTTLNNGSRLIVNGQNGMNLGYEGYGVLNINANSTFEATQDYGVAANGTMNVNGGTVKIAGTLANAGTVYVTGEANLDAEVTGAGWFYMNGVSLDADTKLVGAKVAFINGENTVKGSTIKDGFFSVGVGQNAEAEKAAAFAQANGITLGNVTVNVSENANIGGNGETYSGWVGSAYSADKTQNEYTLNINNSQAAFGYMHVSKDGVLNVDGRTIDANKYKNDGANVDFYAGDFIVNGNVTFNNADAWAKFAKMSVDHADGVLNINGDAMFEASIHNGGTSSTSLKFWQAGKVNVAKTATMEIDNGTVLVEGAELNIAGYATAKGAITGNGTINFTEKEAKLAAQEGLTINHTFGDSYKVERINGVYGIYHYVASVDDMNYESLKAALQALTDGDTLTLLEDITEEAWACHTITANNVTINGAGKTVTFNNLASGEAALCIDSDVTVKDITLALGAEGNAIISTGNAENVTISGSTFTNANVNISAIKKVVFYNNKLVGGDVIITSTDMDNVDVHATSNTLDESKLNQIISNPYKIKAQDNFDIPVAKVKENNMYYLSLQEAVNVGGTIDVLTDIVLTDAVKVNNAVVLNLTHQHTDGVVHNVLITAKKGAVMTGGLLRLLDGADVTINGNDKCAISYKFGTATNVNVYAAVSILGDAKLTVNGGKLTGYYYGIAGNGTSADGAEIIINGGTIAGVEGTGFGIYHPQNGTLTVTGGTITGPTGIYFKSGDLEIVGGTIHGTGEKAAYGYTGSGANATGDALVIENVNHNTGYDAVGTISITGGTFISDKAAPIASYAPEFSTAKVEFLGENCNALFNNDNIDENCLAIGYQLKENNDGLYGVKFTAEREFMTIVDGEYTEFVNDTTLTIGELTYVRNFGHTSWQVLYVPFAIPVENLTDDFDVFYINDVHQYDDNDDGIIDRTTVESIRKKAGVLLANYPYLIKAKTTGQKTITVTNVKLCKTEVNSIDCSSVFDKYTFTGTYTRKSAAELPKAEGYYILSGGDWVQFAPTNITGGLGAFRFYLKIDSRSEATVEARSIEMRVVGEENEDGTTLIYDVESDNQNVDYIYDLQGRRVLEPQKGGLYIINGKKVVF